MAAALMSICVDNRLNHEVIRAQIHQRLERMSLQANRIFIVNEVGGNVGSNFRNTLRMFVQINEPLVVCGALHHDDCIAAGQGMRLPLDMTADIIAAWLRKRGIACPVLTGTVRTENSEVSWSDGARLPSGPFGVGKPVPR